MRKLLLASAAVLGAAVGMAGITAAQAADPLTPTPAPMHPSAFSIAPAGGPNSFQVHLDGRLNWYAGVAGGSLDNPSTRAEGGPAKTAPYDLQGYIRLYPGFTAVAANGLQYGVAAEARMPGVGGGHAGVTPGSTSSSETLYWRRAYGFVATPELGTLRFGMGDGITDLFQVGTFEGFNDGAWNGDLPGFFQGDTVPAFLFADVGTLYTSNKIVYVSPSFSGFQFGVDFEPNTANLYNDSGCGATYLTCNRLSSQGLVLNNPRRRDTATVGVKYTGTFGGVGIDASATYIGSSVVHNTTPGALQYNGLSVGSGGLTASYAGFTVGGHVAGGDVNGDFSLKPDGGRKELGWMVGAQYETGPFVVGASYFQSQFAGNWFAGGPVGRTENDTGVAAGATYTVAPGFDLFLSYLYGTKHQANWNFATGTPGVGSNSTHGQAFALGTQLAW